MRRLLQVEADKVFPTREESYTDGGWLMLLKLRMLSERPTDCPQTAPNKRPPDLLVTEVGVYVRPGPVDWVYLHVDMTERTDRPEAARPQLTDRDHRGLLELSWLQLVY